MRNKKMEKRKLTCWEFGLINSMIQTIWKNITADDRQKSWTA